MFFKKKPAYRLPWGSVAKTPHCQRGVEEERACVPSLTWELRSHATWLDQEKRNVHINLYKLSLEHKEIE